MVPKIIHLCWFSGDPYPPLIDKCIRSWAEQMPDYKVRIWTYADAEAIDIPYLHEALSVRKWAFAADVVRMYALYSEGGVYLDSDLYVKKDLTPLFTDRFISSIEVSPEQPLPSNYVALQAAFMAAEKGHPFLKDLMDYYRTLHFLGPDNMPRMGVLAPEYYAKVAEKYGFVYQDTTQHLREGMIVYASKYVACHYLKDNPEAYAIHACHHSWGDKSWLKRTFGPTKQRMCKWFKRTFSR